MAIRISGINIPDNKRIVISLQSIFGIGPTLSSEILEKIKITEDTKASELTSAEEKSLRDYIEQNIKVEGDLRREVSANIKHQTDVNSYRGDRHASHLPVRGQRTKTNSRTVRGNIRKTAGSGRKATGGKT